MQLHSTGYLAGFRYAIIWRRLIPRTLVCGKPVVSKSAFNRLKVSVRRDPEFVVNVAPVAEVISISSNVDFPPFNGHGVYAALGVRASCCSYLAGVW